MAQAAAVSKQPGYLNMNSFSRQVGFVGFFCNTADNF